LKLGDAAAFFVESGRALGAAEQSRAFAVELESLGKALDGGPPAAFRAVLAQLVVRHGQRQAREEGAAQAARRRAEELLAGIEAPGRELRRRLLAAAVAGARAFSAGDCADAASGAAK
jgi:hypothetical protein